MSCWLLVPALRRAATQWGPARPRFLFYQPNQELRGDERSNRRVAVTNTKILLHQPPTLLRQAEHERAGKSEDHN